MSMSTTATDSPTTLLDSSPTASISPSFLAVLIEKAADFLLAKAFEQVWSLFVPEQFDTLVNEFRVLSAQTINEVLIKQAKAALTNAHDSLLKYQSNPLSAKALDYLRDAEKQCLEGVNLLQETGKDGTGLYAGFLLEYYAIIDKLILVTPEDEAGTWRAYRKLSIDTKLPILLTSKQATIAARLAEITPIETRKDWIDWGTDHLVARDVYRYTDNGPATPVIRIFDNPKNSPPQNLKEAETDRARYISLIEDDFDLIDKAVVAIRSNARLFNDGDIVAVSFPASVGNRCLTAANYVRDYEALFISDHIDEWKTFRVQINDDGTTSLIFHSGIGDTYLTPAELRVNPLSLAARFMPLNNGVPGSTHLAIDVNADVTISISLLLNDIRYYLTAHNYHPQSSSYEARFVPGQPNEWSRFKVRFLPKRR